MSYNETVSSRLHKEKYHCTADGRDPLDICGRYQPTVTEEADALGLRVLCAMQYASSRRDDMGYIDPAVGIYFYIFFRYGKYKDPYITLYVPINGKKRDEFAAMVKSIQIHVDADGKVTIIHPDGKIDQSQLPLPDPKLRAQDRLEMR